MSQRVSRRTDSADQSTGRIAAVDLLRGLVIVIMAIDHTRDFIHAGAMNFQPEDLTKTTPAIFFTRWITHFCAPAFMFCAGLGASLRLQRRLSTSSTPAAAARDLSRFLWTRGLWLIVLELTVVRLGFFFNVKYDLVFLLVFWALGLSMIALAVLSRLPFRALLVSSLALIALHNLLDTVKPAWFGQWGWVWNVLHQPGFITKSPPLILVSYPVLPWIGVMAFGFCVGRLYRLRAAERQRWMIRIGLVASALFIALRALNVYGDPRPWSPQSSPVMTMISFLNCTKYPPSLLFLLMTLGPALIALAYLERIRTGGRNPLLVFGRVPLLFFVLHLPLIHACAIGLTGLRYGHAPFLFTPPPSVGTDRAIFPPDYGWGLLTVYGVWLFVLISLYPVCLWFSRLKARRRDWWLSYL